ncbi:MAG TPA: CHAP domain-containing protein [Polyangiaceae bacterium]|nr:CHAP domain-containing protein [Polyangiaceae bacterium]
MPRLSQLGALSLLALGGCSGPVSEPEPVAEISQAINVCDETVPANRFVDGFPAYAQCDSTNSSAIWSNNGIDTALTSQGTGWIRTQRSGGYQCTEWAWRYMHFRWGIDYQNGNAGGWCDGNLPATLTKATTPVHGDLIVFAPGVCGADGTTGHIAVIDVVNTSAGTVTLVEENSAGRRNAKISCATCFLHAVANDGTGSGGAAGSPGSGGGGATNTNTGGASNGGRATSGGARTSGGAGPVSSGGSSSGGAPQSGGTANGGASSGGTLTTTGGSGGSSGTPSSSGGAVSVSSGGNPSTGGSPVTGGIPGTAGSSGGGTPTTAVTGGASGSSTTAGQPNTGTAGSPPADPLSDDINNGCGLSKGAPRAGFTGVIGQFALALVGFALRRRSLRRRASSHEA